MWWCWCRCEGCCSILALELGAGFTLADYFFEALLMPGQKRLPHASNCDFVISWWNWCSWCRVLSLLAGGMTSASPCRTRPSSMVRVYWCCQYGQRGQGTSLMSSGQPVTMRSARALIFGSLMKACWKASLWSGIMWAWWMVISNGRSGPGQGLNRESVSGMTISLPGW